ncbi:peptidoglycan DD-metalloendopeptidase family protein [Nocardia farcinica]
MSSPSRAADRRREGGGVRPTGGVIEHIVHGERVASLYVHMWSHGIHVAEGDTVTAGQHIGDVGSRDTRPARTSTPAAPPSTSCGAGEGRRPRRRHRRRTGL